VGSFVLVGTVCTHESIATVLVLSSLVYFAGKLLRKKKSKFYLISFITILIIAFVIKNYQIAEIKLIQAIGLSYILFRLIHFLIESNRGTIKDYNYLSFLNYIIFFPTFIAGPIDEYNNFNYWIKQKRNTYKTILIKAGTFRLLLGVVKKFFLVPIIVNYSLDFSLFGGGTIWQSGFIYSLLLYSLYILFDFSGYSDIAIGTAYLIGIKTPENFDNPYFSRNLSIFWKKWHMTFSNFLFRYVFKPIVVNLSSVLKKTPRLLITFIGYILTFIICGIWHGNTMNFVYWGLFHGLGLILFKLWNLYVYKIYIQAIKSNFFHWAYNSLAIIITFLFVTAGWFLFNYKSNDISLILNNINSSNNEKVTVNTIIYNKTAGIEINYVSNHEFIDIEYTSAKNDSLIKLYNIPVRKSCKYYLLPKDSEKELYIIKVRSSKSNNKGEWNVILFYLDEKDINQSNISELIFGKIVPAAVLQEKPDYVNR